MLRDILSGQMSPEAIVGLLVALVLGITVHEFGHALAATWLGDTLPQRQGRLTLAPQAHLDVVGSLMFLVGGFGWGKPVQYNPYALRAGPRTGPAIVSIAGPVMNVILATLLAVVMRLFPIFFANGLSSNRLASVIFQLLFWIVFYNLILAFFNLIPVFPLDGFTVLLGLLPPAMAEQFEQTRQWGFGILILLLFLGGTVLGTILYDPVYTIFYWLTGIPIH